MNSASKVGEIFTKAGEAFNELGDKIILLHPLAQEIQSSAATHGNKIPSNSNSQPQHQESKTPTKSPSAVIASPPPAPPAPPAPLGPPPPAIPPQASATLPDLILDDPSNIVEEVVNI